MNSAFGIDHGEQIAKSDYQRAHRTWERRADRADATENLGSAVAGTTGLVAGAAATRDKLFRQHPERARRLTLEATRLPPKVGETLLHGKPGFKTLAAGTGAAGVALGASQYNKLASRKARHYARKPNQPLSKAAPPTPPTPADIQHKKKVQGVLGTSAAVVGLSAFGAKSGAKLLPKITRGGAKGKAYAKHLDQAADHVLFAGAGLGGASGLHQGAVYRAEGKQKVAKALHDGSGAVVWAKESPGKRTARVVANQRKVLQRGAQAAKVGDLKSLTSIPNAAKVARVVRVTKAYDPERSRQRRAVGYEAGAAGAGVGLAAAAARPNAALAVRGGRMSRKHTEQAKVKYARGRQLLGGSHPAPKQAREMFDAARGHEQAARKMVSLHPAPVSGKQRLALGAGAAVAAGTTAAIHRHRTGDGKPYKGWFDRAPGRRPRV